LLGQSQEAGEDALVAERLADVICGKAPATLGKRPSA
jgi:hypothetical protein